MSHPVHIVCPHCTVENRIPDDRLVDHPKCGKCHGVLFTQSALQLTQANFDKQMMRNDIPLVVDFWAPWCGPCKVMAPAFETAAATLEPDVRLAKLNTEAEQNLAARFNIRSIPTLILFEGGKEIERHSGAMMHDDIVRWVRQHVTLDGS